jgi:inner membrane protein YidH
MEINTEETNDSFPKNEDLKLDPRLSFSIEATVLALERTQLAWIRTLLSMIGGGFVIDKSLEALHKARIESGQAWVRHAHFGGLVITGIGTFLMAVVTILYLKRNWKLVEMNGARKSYLDPAFLLSALTVIVGVMLTYFIAIT